MIYLQVCCDVSGRRSACGLWDPCDRVSSEIFQVDKCTICEWPRDPFFANSHNSQNETLSTLSHRRRCTPIILVVDSDISQPEDLHHKE